jgi:hypothetical protein
MRTYLALLAALAPQAPNLRIVIGSRSVLCLAVVALAQIPYVAVLHAQAIRAGENVRVAYGQEQRPLVEPHLAAHPVNPNHLLGATIVSDTSRAWGETQICSSLLSLDGGKTWERHDFPIPGCGDPWVAITPSGHAVFAAIGTQNGGGLLVFHSADAGRTWDQQPADLGRGSDHPTIAVDLGSSARQSWVYVVATQGVRGENGNVRSGVFVARSRTGGKTFEEPVKVIPSNLNLNAEVPAVLSDGTLVVSFADFQRNVGGFRRGRGNLDRPREWVIVSADGGHTFSIPLFANEQCGRGWSTLTADASSGPFRDRLYHLCVQNGGAIGLTYSQDAGETWVDPVRVHSGPVDPSPQLAVNKAGVLGIAWLDIQSPPGQRCAALYFTASLDGGRTVLPAQRVSTARSCPGITPNGAAFARWPTGGDYFGMAASPDGRFHVLWADARDGLFQLWTAVVEVDGRAAGTQ